MSKTLADMTPAEREQCVGMWCDAESYGSPVILARVNESAATATVPQGPYPSTAPLKDFTPRFDLPRAWGADGEPVKGRWADGHMWWGEDAGDGNLVDVVGAECLDTGAIEGFEEWPDNVTPGEDVDVRRFITDWEAKP